jgi:type I restriction enzyme, S subunit
MSETKATTSLVPKLRFPEFRGAAAWKPTTLQEVSTPVTERVGERKLTPVSISAGIGFVPQAEKFGRDISGNQYELYTLVKDGDFVFNKGNSLKFPQGCVYQVQGWGQVAAPNVFICFRLKDGYSNGFFQNCFEQNQHGRQLKRHITSGARGNGLLNISKDTFFGVEIPIPSAAEQQKIAECLSSVDELIAAHARKVDALKTHKKGLMQQLFPREGQTFPSLRFPEFQKEGDWKCLPLAALADKIMVGIASAATHAYRETGVPMLRNQNIKEGGIDDSSLLFIDPIYEATHKNKRLKAGDVITVRTGYPGLSAVVTKLYENAQCFTSLITRPKVDVLDSYYLCLYINSPIGKKFMLGAEAGGAQKNVNAGTLETLGVYFPQLEEQRKIAATLSSLDALISAETQKLEALKGHKKGLMQQLFPSPEEVDA